MSDPTLPPSHPTPPTEPPTAPPAPPAQPQPAYSAPAPTGSEPGKTLGIVAVVVAIFFNIIGAILGFVARSQSKKAGVKNTPALAAIIIGLVLFVLSIIGVIIFVSLGAALVNTGTDIIELCQNNPGGTVEFQGETISCSQITTP